MAHVFRGVNGYIFILGTVAFTVYGQLVLKWRVGLEGPLPPGWAGKAGFAFRLLIDPWVLSTLLSAFLAFLCWIGALGSFQITYAYPFTSLSFILILALGAAIFEEPLTVGKVLGVLMICCGLVVAGRWS